MEFTRDMFDNKVHVGDYIIGISGYRRACSGVVIGFTPTGMIKVVAGRSSSAYIDYLRYHKQTMKIDSDQLPDAVLIKIHEFLEQKKIDI